MTFYLFPPPFPQCLEADRSGVLPTAQFEFLKNRKRAEEPRESRFLHHLPVTGFARPLTWRFAHKSSFFSLSLAATATGSCQATVTGDYGCCCYCWPVAVALFVSATSAHANTSRVTASRRVSRGWIFFRFFRQHRRRSMIRICSERRLQLILHYPLLRPSSSRTRYGCETVGRKSESNRATIAHKRV